MSLCAIIPIKSLCTAKSRLALALPGHERREFVIAMLSHVESTLGRAGADVILAVGEYLPDFAHRRQIVDDGPGLNENLTRAIGLVAPTPGNKIIVIAADLPCLKTQDINELMLAASSGKIAIATDRVAEGTNALAFDATYRDLRLCFGHRSRFRHERAAKLVGGTPIVIRTHGLSRDVDTPEDLAAVRLLDRSR